MSSTSTDDEDCENIFGGNGSSIDNEIEMKVGSMKITRKSKTANWESIENIELQQWTFSKFKTVSVPRE